VKKVVKRSLPLLAVLVLGALLLAAAASGHGTKQQRSTASIKACALLPDTTTSTRYTLFDAPYLKAAFRKAHVPALVVNAHGDPQKQFSQAQQCIAQGAKVVLLDQLTPASGISITNYVVSHHAKVIDYDRLVVGSKASYYVSFDNVRVGKFQGRGLVGGLKAKHLYTKHPVIAELNGGITDNNASCLSRGTTRSSIRCTRPARSRRRPPATSGRIGARPRLGRSSMRCSPATATRSTACSRPMTASPALWSRR